MSRLCTCTKDPEITCPIHPHRGWYTYYVLLDGMVQTTVKSKHSTAGPVRYDLVKNQGYDKRIIVMR